MTARRKSRRGRPPVFTGASAARYLAAVAAGARLGEAADQVGISRNWPGLYARLDAGFAAALEDAKALGRVARIEALPHDEYRYNHHGCRCELCRKAAAVGRAGRPDRTTRPGGTALVPFQPPHEPFPLARAS